MRSAALAGGVLCGLVLLAGCGTSRPSASADATQSHDRAEPSAIERQLRAAAARWQGTPHEWGGATQRGADCSGLVQSVFRKTLDQPVPRTTREQAQTGERVRRSALQPGDLVFFRVDTRKGRHVGIYLSDGEFLHASASEGVTTSRLDQSYWDRRWWQARRVLSPSVAADADTAASAPRGGMGW